MEENEEEEEEAEEEEEEGWEKGGSLGGVGFWREGEVGFERPRRAGD